MTEKFSTKLSHDLNDIPTCAGDGGGWRRIANVNISTGGDCPSGWRKDTYSGVSFCRVVSDGNFVCSSTNFSTNGISYQRVCGRARGYQKRFTDAFYGCNRAGQTIDGYYVEGISITHGNPRQHIWTYASGLLDNQTHSYNCPCAGGFPSPPFVGTNYYSESGATDTHVDTAYYFMTHCGTDLVTSLATVVTALPNHGFIES